MRSSLIAFALLAMQATSTAPPVSAGRVSGVDAESGIAYALISVDGTLSGATSQPAPPPRLTAQCTKTLAGNLKFELLADLGGVPQIAYYPPWKPNNGTQFPPRLEKAQVVMEFLGYTKVKPVRRQWEYLDQLPQEMRYATPGMSSANMEPISFYMQYLRALPTLRLTVPGRGTAEWETSRWQQQVHAETLCSAAGI